MTAPSIFEHPNSMKVFGPAGAGKTRELVRILREHTDDGDFHLLEGIIVSFTRAAAYDIARRVNPEGYPGRYHCTLHALCKRYYGFEGDVAEPRLREFMKEIGVPYTGGFVGDGEEWAPSREWAPSEGGLLMNFFSQIRNRLLSIEEGLKVLPKPAELSRWWSPEQMGWFWDRYLAWKQENGLYDFTDMLEHAAVNPPQADWAYFVVDEAQDMTPLQWQVAQSFANRAEVVYIGGDDDQAIYAWAGATPHEFLLARTSGESVLRTNYRSGSVIVDAAQAFIRHNADRKDKRMRAANHGGSISRLAGGREMPALDINESTMVMARAHYLLDPIQAELTKLGYPYVDKRGQQGVTGKAAAQYGRFRRLATGQAITLDEWRLLLDAIPTDGPWLSRGAKAQVKRMEASFRLSTTARVRDLTVYGASDEFVNALLAQSLEPLARIDRDRMAYFQLVAYNFGPEYLDEAKAASVCSLGPIHAFKGLECDHAIIHESLSPAAAAEAVLDPEPERRVMYVAMTRAKNRITWVRGPSGTPYGQVLL